MPKTYKKRRGGMPPTRRENATTAARPQSRAALARESEARARALIRDYYRPPVIRGDAIDDSIVSYLRNFVTQKIEENPNRRQEILNALDNLRRAKYEERARSVAHDRAQEASERNLPGSDVNSRRPFRQAEEEASTNSLISSRAVRAAEQQLDSLLYSQEEIQEQERNYAYGYDPSDEDEEPTVEIAEEPIDFEPIPIQPLNITADCQTDLNSSGEYISGISLEELMNGQSVKLSDGHCYNNTDIVNYYRDKRTRQQPFISPFNRQRFSQQDINIVKTIIHNMENALPEQGGYKKHKKTTKRKTKKSKKARKSKK